MQSSSLVRPLSLITLDQHAGVRVCPSRVGGQADFSQVSGDATAAPDQSQKGKSLGSHPREKGAERGGREALVSSLHAGRRAMHQKMTTLPVFLK